MNNTVLNQPLAGILGIVLKPGFGTAQAKGISPAIHITEHTGTTQSVDKAGEQNLQKTDAVFFIVIAFGISIQCGTTLGVHADIVTGFVQG